MNKKIVSFFSILLVITTTTFSYATTQISDTNLNISDNQPTGSLYVYTPGDYLIKTEWGQWGLYNDLCPDNDTRPPPKEERLGCWSP